MTITTPPAIAVDHRRRSVFASADVCHEAGLTLPAGARRPVFENDLWDFTEVIGLPNQMAKVSRRFDFAAIINTGWRQVAKEQVVAMLAPRHDAVALLPRAYRTPLHLLTVFGRLAELTRFLNWLTGRGVTALADVDDQHCQAYLAHRRYLCDENDVVVGELSPATRKAAAQVVVDLANHRELFSTDQVRAGWSPWQGAAPSAVAEMPCRAGHNKTPPVNDAVLQPMLAAAGYLVNTLGAHAVELSQHIRDADRKFSVRSGEHRAASRVPIPEFTQLLADYERTGEPLPLLPEHHVRDRVDAGWPPDDPLTPIALGLLARQAGITQFSRRWIPRPAGPDRGHPGRGRRGETLRPRRRQRRPRRRPPAASHGPPRCTGRRPPRSSGSSAPRRSSPSPHCPGCGPAN